LVYSIVTIRMICFITFSKTTKPKKIQN
jgi:hypothetical protein